MIRSIKAILFKELRENVFWMMLVSVMTTGSLAVGVFSGFDSGLPLIQKSMLSLCMLMYPLAGLSLGWLQVYQDHRPGRWQFVSHRPMPSSQLFAGKIAVGLMLYAVATLIPLAIISACVAAPGYIPGPFTWDMTLPALTYICSGVMWYAIGLLIAARKARWYGSRLMPVGVAIVATFAFHIFAVRFINAIEIMLPCTALLLAAAWGAFAGGEDGTRAPIWTQPCTVLAVVTGWLLTVGAGIGICGEFIQSFSPIRTWAYSTYYRLDSNGKLRTVQDSYAYGKDDLAATNLNLNRNNWSIASRAQMEGFLRSETYARVFYLDGNIQWFCLPALGTIEGYRSKDGRHIESIGQDGFSTPGHAVQPFGRISSMPFENLNGSQTLVVQNQVFYVDIANRKVSTISFDEPVLAEGNLNDTKVIATRSAIHLIDRDRESLTLPVEELSSNITVGRTDDGRYVVGYDIGFPAGWNAASVLIYDQHGKFLNRTDLPATVQNISDAPRPWWYEPGQLIPSPPAFFATVYTLHYLDDRQFQWKPVLHLLSVVVLYLAIAFVMLRARHASRKQFSLWLVITPALGLSGILLLMSMWEKPKSARCRSCGKRRLITESACPACGTPAETPGMEGIEILEPLACAVNY